MKNFKIVGVLSTLVVASVAVLSLGQSYAANTATNTTLGITQGVFSFYKDTGATMDSYFSHSANAAATIDIGTYNASLSAINAASAGDHRFTISDLKGDPFTVTLQSSALTASGSLSIAADLVSYTGSTWLGTGKALTSAPTSAADIGTAPVTFVARADNSGISKYSQEITLKVAVPAAQAPASYTGLLTFTY